MGTIFKKNLLFFIILIFLLTTFLFRISSPLYAAMQYTDYTYQTRPNLAEGIVIEWEWDTDTANRDFSIDNISKAEYINDESIVQVIYLNNQTALWGLGHTAMILVKSDGSGIYYSKGAKNESIVENLKIYWGYEVDGKIDKQYLTSDDMANFLPGGSGKVPNSGYQYTRYISISVTEDMGNQMRKMAEMKYNSKPWIYNLFHDNCNQFVQQVMEAAKINFIFVDMIPSLAYKVGALIWPNSSGPYDLNIIDKIGSAVADLSINVGSGFGNLLNQTQFADSSELLSQLSISTSQIATEVIAAIPPPSKPSLVSPYNWYQSLGSAPTLIWKGDENSVSYYVIVNSSNTGDIKSGWIGSTSWKPNLPNENYIYSWKVKAKNSQGVESEWSEKRNFSVASTTLKFEGNISFSPPSPSSADRIKIFASTTGWGGVGVTLRVSVNTAPDGSSSGEWKILKELGVPKFNEEDAPVWDTKGWQNGKYRIRVEAKGSNDPNWRNPAVVETTYTLVNKSSVTESHEESITDIDPGSLLLNESFSSGNLGYWNTVGDVTVYNDGGNNVAKCVSRSTGGAGNEYTDMYYHFYPETNNLSFSCRIKPVSFNNGNIQVYIALFSSGNLIEDERLAPIYYPGDLPTGSWRTFSVDLSGYPSFDMIIVGAIVNGDNVVYFDDFRIY
jgi:hypothetical protein